MKLLQQRRRIGDLSPHHHRAGRKPKILPRHRQRFQSLLKERPALTLAELRIATGLNCNLPPHKTSPVESLVRAAGVKLRWLPPNLNPIEKMWSKIKESLRSAKARTFENLQSAIANVLKSVMPDDAAHWFASCGYAIS